MNRKYRVAVLGLGHWYSAYTLARSLPEYPRAELIAAAWPNREQLDPFAKTFCIHGYENYHDLLAREDIDIVHLAAPVSSLTELAIASAKAGKHILLGKPMAMNLEEADRIVAAVEAAGVTCVPYSGLTRLRTVDLKARVDAGEIGDVIVMHQTSRWSIAEDGPGSGRPGWFVDPRHVPGGALIDEGIYWIELFEWMAGSPIVQAEARVANLVHKDIEVEDWGMATFTCANGVVATLEASWTINSPKKTAPSPKQNAVVRLELVGTRGEIIDQWFRSPGRAILGAGAADWVFQRQPEQAFSGTFPLALNHLVECLDKKRQPDVTVQEARSAFRAAMAAYQSAREGTPVTVTAHP
jgi:predicted dehydrogenase